MKSLLPPSFSTSFCINDEQLQHYLDAVGGGHPVHASKELALQAGFNDKPLPGVHVQGAALAAFTRQFADKPLQLLRICSRFLAPVYPGQQLQLELKLIPESVKIRPAHQSGAYVGHCLLPSGKEALELEIELRIVVT